MPDKKLTDSEIPNVKELLEDKVKVHCELCDFKNSDCCGVCMYTAIKQFIELFNRLQAEKDDLFYKLVGVMHSVDKWLDGDELKQDEVNRAATMREKTLQIVESLQAENERLRKAIENTDYAYFKKSCELDNLTYDFELLKQEKSVVKAEAYKEFAERLMLMVDNAYTCDIIDNLLKEKVGESGETIL